MLSASFLLLFLPVIQHIAKIISNHITSDFHVCCCCNIFAFKKLQNLAFQDRLGVCGREGFILARVPRICCVPGLLKISLTLKAPIAATIISVLYRIYLVIGYDLLSQECLRQWYGLLSLPLGELI